MTKKHISRVLNVVFILTVVLFMLDNVPSFDIKNQVLKSFTYYGVMILAPLMLVWNLLVLKTRRLKILGSILPAIFTLAFVIVGPMSIVFWSGSWKTQTILYQNGHLGFKRVEFQKQDIGALGYNQRTVEVIYLTNLFMIISPVDKDVDNLIEWAKVNEEVNELGLKYP